MFPKAVLAALTGVGVGLLSVLAGNALAGGVLAAFITAGGAVPVFNQMIAPDPTRSRPAVRETEVKGGNAHG